MPVPARASTAERSLFRGYRFPHEVIAHAVWLYFRFHLSLRDVQDLLAERGLVVSHESIRHWCDTFGPTFAARLRKRRARPGDKWHCEELLLKIKGKRYWLWRAVDQDGIVLDILVRSGATRLRPRRSCAKCWPVGRACHLVLSSPTSWPAMCRRSSGYSPPPSIDATRA